jgi:hypothetical protein
MNDRSGSSSVALSIDAAFIADIGSPFPVRMTLAGDELDFTFLFDDDLESWIELRPGLNFDGRVSRYFVSANGRRIRLELAGAAVQALIVLPGELVTQSSTPLDFGRWPKQVPGSLRLVVEESSGCCFGVTTVSEAPNRRSISNSATARSLITTPTSPGLTLV